MKLIRFYQQYKVDDFLEMDLSLLSVFIRGMTQLQAEEHLMSMDAISYPQSDQKSRKASHKKWSKLAYPENFEDRAVKTTDLELF
jgi:hypothetical protein